MRRDEAWSAAASEKDFCCCWPLVVGSGVGSCFLEMTCTNEGEGSGVGSLEGSGEGDAEGSGDVGA